MNRERSRAAIPVAFALLCALQAMNLWILNSRPVLTHGLVGPDSYMRLVQVEELYTHGRWYDTTHYRLNAPFTETNQWTRAMDLLLLPGAWLGAHFGGDAHTGLWWSGVLIGPLLACMWLTVWIWGTRGLLGTRPLLTSVLLIGLSPGINGAFAAGRADHHGLLLLTMTIAFCCLLRAGIDGARLWHGICAGAAAGIGVWVSIEAMFTAAVFAGWVALCWALPASESARNKLLPSYLCGLICVIGVAIMAEHPPEAWLMPYYSRISIVHGSLVLFGALPCLAAVVLWRHERGKVFSDTTRKRAIVLVTAACAALFGEWLCYPNFYAGPFSDFDHTVFTGWLGQIQEWQPLLPTNRSNAARFLVQLMPGVIGAVYVFSRTAYLCKARDPLASAYALTGLVFLACIPMALWAGRFAMYTQLVNLLALPRLIDTVMCSPRLVCRSCTQWVSLRVPVAAAILTCPLLIGGLLTPRTEAQTPHTAWRDMARHIDTLTGKDPQTVVFTYLYRGPILLWNASFRVVGGPYGNTRALQDTDAILNATSVDDAANMIEQRSIRFVVVAHRAPENHLYIDSSHETFLMRLLAGRTPDWAEDVALPEHLAAQFSLYRTHVPDTRDQGSFD